MPRPYSPDLRERVIGAVEAGQSRRAVARRFGVSIASVVKWVQRFRRTGLVAAERMGGRRPYALAEHRAFVLERFAEKADLTVSEVQAELAARGVKVSRYAVWHFVRHERLTFKKKRARQRTGQARRGQAPHALEASSR